MLTATMTDALPESVLSRAVAAVYANEASVLPLSISTSSEHSNAQAEIRFANGRTLMVKRARHTWASARFTASRRACHLLRKRTGIIAPEPLDLPEPDDGFPVEAYWRIDLPTLGEVWPHLSAQERGWALRHWGRLMARVHGVRFRGHGPLAGGELGSLSGYLEADLGERLLPASQAVWPEGVPLVASLLESAPSVACRTDGDAVLVHNDLHMRNVLCKRTRHSARAVGVLDLEAAFAGPPEADMAHTEVLHGPICGMPLPSGWLQEVRRGYGRGLDPVVLAFFRAYHLANLGFHAALCGWPDRAAEILALAVQEDLPGGGSGSRLRVPGAVAAPV